MNKGRLLALVLTLTFGAVSAFAGAEGHGRHGTRGGKSKFKSSGGSNIGGVCVNREGTGVGNG